MCKKCGELNYLTPHAFWNISDVGVKCDKCNAINTITLENWELKKQLRSVHSEIPNSNYNYTE
jgi:phage FluMu protein Com